MYSRVLQLDPTDGMAWKDWAMAKLENGNYKSALMGFTKAEIYMPDKDHADYIYYHLGIVYTQIEKWFPALYYLLKCTIANDGHPYA